MMKANENSENEIDKTEWLLLESLADENKQMTLKVLGIDLTLYHFKREFRINKNSEEYLNKDTKELEQSELIRKISINNNWEEGPESIIKKNLMIANYETAIDCCFKCGRTVLFYIPLD